MPDYISLPLRVGSQNELMLSASINGKRAWLVVDTGAPLTCIDQSRAAHFGLAPFNGRNGGPTVLVNGVERSVSVVNSLQLGGVAIMGAPVVLVDLKSVSSKVSRSKIREDGVLGLDLLFALSGVLDCSERRLYLKTNLEKKPLPSSAFRAKGWTEVPMRLVNGHLVVRGRVEGQRVKLVTDTGSPVSVLDRAFCEQRGIETSRPVMAAHGLNFQDDSTAVAGIERFSVGRYEAGAVPVAVFDLAGLFNNSGVERKRQPDGLLGSRTLLKHGAIIDSANRKLYLRKTGRN